MFMNILSLSMTHCPEPLLTEKVSLRPVFESLSDVLGLQPIASLVLTSVDSHAEQPEQRARRGLTGFVNAGTGYLYIRTWPDATEPSVTLHFGTCEEFETPRIRAWLEQHFQVKASDLLVHFAMQGMRSPRPASTSVETMAEGMVNSGA